MWDSVVKIGGSLLANVLTGMADKGGDNAGVGGSGAPNTNPWSSFSGDEKHKVVDDALDNAFSNSSNDYMAVFWAGIDPYTSDEQSSWSSKNPWAMNRFKARLAAAGGSGGGTSFANAATMLKDGAKSAFSGVNSVFGSSKTVKYGMYIIIVIVGAFLLNKAFSGKLSKIFKFNSF